ncbi:MULTISPECIES: FDLD family class I lanthipeptide [unclassified Streptomyces]|uniref:FDLD family class I lanthipeptide n=1 Tax=unclassified Streptomyces TaxID=2593676 RepID=UPI00338D3F27
MSVSLVDPVVREFGLDEFDLDVRIAVSSDMAPIEAGFSNWYSCKGTCGMQCVSQPIMYSHCFC